MQIKCSLGCINWSYAESLKEFFVFQIALLRHLSCISSYHVHYVNILATNVY